MPWTDVYERWVLIRAQERDRDRSRIPETAARLREQGTGEGVTVRDKGRFDDQTGIRIIGFDFRIGG